MKRSWLLPAAFVAMMAAPAFAADMPLKAPPPPAPVATWSGFYTGVEVGEVWNHADWNPTCIDAGGAPLGTCGSPLSTTVFPGAPDSAATFTGHGTRVGIYSGFMWEAYDRWVFGAESDFAFRSQNGTVGGIIGCMSAACTGFGPIPPATSFFGDSTTLHLGDDYAFRVRAGFLVLPQLQLYAAGGPAAQKVSATLVCSTTGAAGCITNISTFNETTLVGYTVGGGLEWKAWEGLLLRAEYRYNDYGTWKQSGFLGSGQIEEFANVHVKTQQFNVGIAWLFPPPRW